MQDVLIVAHFTQVPGEIGNGRFHYIAENLSKQNTRVEVVTTSFSHSMKTRRKVTTEQLDAIGYELTMIDEPGYQGNISIKRLLSHYVMGKKVKRYLETRKKPDVIYCSVPSLSVARAVAEYAVENSIRYIIDIQDLWPEAFRMVLGATDLGDFLLMPMQKVADDIYRAADDIVAVSQTYLDRALQANAKCEGAYTIFLGTDLLAFDRLVKENNMAARKPKNEVWLAYVGTLGYSYDIYCVLDALLIIKNKGITNIRFIVMGDGPLRRDFENYAKAKGVSAEFTGRLEYSAMVGLLSACDIAVNPITGGSAGSIINKHGDYAAAGLPVLNTQESKEYEELVEMYQMGLNCKNGDPLDLAAKILILSEDESLRNQMGRNSRALAEERFDRRKTYTKIMQIIQG